jgi:RND family efflux transporter MFP subunit
MAKAARDLAHQNWEWTVVTAPTGGRIGRQLIDPGNMVQADVTPLTTIVSLDPMYVFFDVDERTTLRVRRLIRSGKMKSSQEANLPVFAGLVDEEGFPHEGTIDFVDNRTDPMAGTLRIRGKFPNADRIFSPGMFVRVRTPIGKPHEAVLIPEQALGTDQGQSFVYVVNNNKKGDFEVEYRPVKLGLLQGDMRVIEDDGLKAGETVVLKGLQRIKPNALVAPITEEVAKEREEEKKKAKAGGEKK